MTVARVCRFGANIALARLLLVESFGVLGMASAVVAILAALREAGLGQAYIQREPLPGEDPREAADTVFAAMAVLNGVLFLVTLLGASSLAGFFDEDASSVEPVLQALACLFLLEAFVATPQVVLQREMAFDKIARAQVEGTVSSAVVAVGLALAGAGVWALVAGQVAERLVMGVRLAASAGWRPGLRGSWRVARGLIRFGKYLWGFAVVSSIGNVLDRIVVGKMYGTTGLGGYSQAFNICFLPASLIAQLVNRVALPAMARIQADHDRMRRAFLKSLDHVAFLALPIGAGMFVTADLFVPVVYGTKWTFIVPLVEVLSVYGTVLAVSSVCGPVLQAMNRPQLFFYIEVARRGLLLVLLLLFASRGELAIAWCVLVALSALALVSFVLIARLVRVDLWAIASPLLRSLSAAILMASVVYAARMLMDGHTGKIAELALAVVAGITSYPAFSLVTNRATARNFYQTVREVRSAPRVS